MRRTKEEAAKTREAVLNAASQVIVRQGIGGFTIEAVSQEAGVTKGGVLHHFPSKEALIDGLIDQVTQVFFSRITAELEAEPEGTPGRWLRAYIRTIFSVESEVINLIPPLASAVFNDQETIDQLQGVMNAAQLATLQDGIDPTTATMIRLAIDGIIFTRAFNLSALDEDSNQQVYDKLISLTRVG